jgi:L-ectoine synthase
VIDGDLSHAARLGRASLSGRFRHDYFGDMIVVTSEEIANSPRHVFGPGWDSKRMIVKQHGGGFSMHATRVSEGAELTMQYLNHVEVNYCMAGEGEVTDVATGIT